MLSKSYLFANKRTCSLILNSLSKDFIRANHVGGKAAGLLARSRCPTNTARLFQSTNLIQVRISSSGPGADIRPEACSIKSNRSKARSIIELMRWDKPTGTLLALMPSLWSVGLATPCTNYVPNIETIVIFTAGAIVARGMGCTLNDLLDRKYDRLVERTKLRPIACGDISAKEALVYLSVQSLIGLYILCLNNIAVIKLGLFSGLMISSYPLFKRFTHWPQVMLAFTMNWGVLMGYAAIKGSLCLSDATIFLPIYMGSIFWTLYYDTIYAHQDKTDDMFIGVKSSALRLGLNTRRFLYQMSGGMVASLALAGFMTDQMWPYHLSVLTTGLLQFNQIRNIDLDDKDACWRAFDQQKYIGFLIFAGVIASVALRSRMNSRVKLEER